MSGYSCTTSMKTSPTDIVIPNSSRHSLMRASCFVSPASTFPPTYSYKSPRALCSDRRQIRNRSPSHISAATTSVMLFLSFDHVSMSTIIAGFCLLSIILMLVVIVLRILIVPEVITVVIIKIIRMSIGLGVVGIGGFLCR